MLNGQLQLTDTAGAPMPRLRRPLYLAGAISLVVLAGCASGPARPVVDMAGGQQTTATAQPGGSYVVKPGDTLYKIARSNNVDVENVKRWNNLSDPNQISVGQVLKLSGGGAGGATQVTPVASAKSSSTQPRRLISRPTAAPRPRRHRPPRPPRRPRRPKTGARGRCRRHQLGLAGHRPDHQGFNNNTKGIDIAGNLGDPVIAAADGKVMYSGNGVRGLGNLIIVNHQNGFITAYAHNRALLVKTGQDVKRGAKIAEIGQSDATSPRLHFEIRRQGTPVDPMQYLPAR